MAADPFDTYIDRIHDLYDRIHMRSVMRIASEMKQQAEQEHQLIPFLLGNFYIMNSAQSLYQPRIGVEAAVENIAYLESEEKAREFQPNFVEDEYYHTVYWMSACSYDNLGKHVAAQRGYNSADVQNVVDEGIEVCHRTGKLECVNCFREYATDVYRVAGDLELALQYARRVMSSEVMPNRGDRRHVGARDVVNLLILQGKLSEAVEALPAALDLTTTYHSTLEARLDTQILAETLACLRGDPDLAVRWYEEAGYQPDWDGLPPEDESPSLAFKMAQLESVKQACQGRYDEAIEILTEWARRLRRWEIVDDWCEAMTRLIGLHLLGGMRERAESLAKALGERATETRSYFFHDRVRRMLEGKIPPSPVAFSEVPSAGPFAPQTSVQAEPETTAAAAQSTAAAATSGDSEGGEAEPPKPPFPELKQWWQRMVEAAGTDTLEQTANEVVDEIRNFPLGKLDEGENVGWAIYAGTKIAMVVGRVRELWDWAYPQVKRFPEHPTVLNVVAHVGALAREEVAADSSGEPDAICQPDTLERMFRKSLQLETDRAGHFFRAGQFFRSNDNLKDAEWCFSRAFSIDRTYTEAAGALAGLYVHQERANDALTVLDLCLRSGGDDPYIARMAGILAFGEKRYQEAATYLTKYLDAESGDTWMEYYRTWSLLELGRFDEAEQGLGKIDVQTTGVFPHLTLAAWIAHARGDVDTFSQSLQSLMELPLWRVEELTQRGIYDNLQKLYALAAQTWPEDHPQRQAFEQRLMESHMAGDEQLEVIRLKRPKQPNLNYYVCEVVQPVDENWASFPGRLSEEPKDWSQYRVYWGVLARNREEAEAYVHAMQERCYPLPCQISDCEPADDGYEDSPGVVWQGTRQPMQADSQDVPG